MEYVFGAEPRGGIECEVLKTIGSRHSDLQNGRNTIVREYPDRTVEDTFFVMKKFRTEETESGSCYDWYLIKEHNRDTDRFTPYKEEIDSGISDTQDAVCTLSEDMESRIADIEDALCSLTEEE
jgi:hypothetical protein